MLVEVSRGGCVCRWFSDVLNVSLETGLIFGFFKEYSSGVSA